MVPGEGVLPRDWMSRGMNSKAASLSYLPQLLSVDFSLKTIWISERDVSMQGTSHFYLFNDIWTGCFLLEFLPPLRLVCV
jgi:hypothetical protein